eukprot:7069329-Alexandrium_andersonii.AAC.1
MDSLWLERVPQARGGPCVSARGSAPAKSATAVAQRRRKLSKTAESSFSAGFCGFLRSSPGGLPPPPDTPKKHLRHAPEA